MKSFINNSFSKGPSSDCFLSPHHGGPILNMDVKDDIAVTCSTDHGARMYNLISGQQIKQLYTKQFGHTEWVTCAKILNNGKILTGGMDSKICYWERSGKCIDLLQHEGSISKIMTDENDASQNVFLSSSYDSTIRIYITSTGENIGVLKGVHRKPVTEFVFTNSIVASADRDGNFVVWDLNRQNSIFNKNIHQGQVSNIIFHSEGLNSNDANLIITSGVNDGIVNGIDMRTSEKAFSKQIHKGAINLLKSSKKNILLTGSADKTIKAFDITKGLFNDLVTMKSTDAVFCGDLVNDFLVVGVVGIVVFLVV